jgi:xanthine dehydrogenase accessory factor
VKNRTLVLFRGAGDLATGAIRRLKIAGFDVVATELAVPLAIRRGAAFSEAIYGGRITVEGITAVRSKIDGFKNAIADGFMPVVPDPEGELLKLCKCDILVDGRMTKKKTDTHIADAPIIIGMGSGFTAGTDCHAVVETKNGEDLGRVIYKGIAAAHTGIPKENDIDLRGTRLTDVDVRNLIYFAEGDGVFKTRRSIADSVTAGDALGEIGCWEITARSAGTLRGILHTETRVRKGTKLVEIDPLCRRELCFRVSAKANAVAGGVLEAVFELSGRIPKRRDRGRASL